MTLAAVTEKGAILLTETVSVDGFHPRSPLRVVTHIHSDHMIGLSESVRLAQFIVATPLTHKLIRALDYRVPSSKAVELPYNVPIEYEDVRLTLLYSNHIPGSAQTVVETRDGYRLAYTGDFKQPGTPVVEEPDVLVIDATYGYEKWVRPWQNEVEDILVDIVLEALAKGGGVVIEAYQGKLQKVMHLLRESGVDAPFIAPRRVYQVAKVLAEHGLKTGDVVVDTAPEAVKAMKSGWYVYFTTGYAFRRLRFNGRKPVRIELTGWELDEPYRRVNEYEWVVSYSDHADFKQTLEYVEEAKPRLLVVDAYRGGSAARYFAAAVAKRLGIPSIALP